MKFGITAAVALCLATEIVAHSGASNSTGLEKIKHFVYFMQENRAFDHYYGTMAGVRGFNDPNVGIQEDGNSLYYQPYAFSPDKKNGTRYLLPFQFTGNRAGCTVGGSNGWVPNHLALNNGKNNNWPLGNSPMSMGYETREQIPFHFALAEEFTVADMYFQYVIASTDPNRVVWISGTNSDGGYFLQDNVEWPKLKWSTYPQNLTTADVSWQVFQDNDNFDDDPLKWFQYWSDLPDGPEKSKGLGFLGIKEFQECAANGTLPQVSYIVGAQELSEHPDNCPSAGAWLQKQVVESVMHSPLWNSTALIINYDESGGFFDHVVPPQAPKSEWQRAVLEFGIKRSPGLGPRVPFICISPYCRGGNVFTEVSDHRSTLMLLEKWIGKGKNGDVLAPAGLVSPWARQTASSLVNLFDFENPDFSIPKLPYVATPSKDSSGKWDPTEMCEKLTDPKSKPPYGNQKMPVVEKGSKRLRGYLTEGRYLIFRSGYHSLQSQDQKLVVGISTLKLPAEVFIVNETNGSFQVMNNKTGSCINVNKQKVELGGCGSTLWNVTYTANGATYKLHDSKDGQGLTISSNNLKLTKSGSSFQIHSVQI
ncbi:phosphoesterase family-domain-containing protein [Umbelopsis sp. PMI_123]|nr:phosphoesterase family-domain-containing protein [Umbelopsis sp. PMI_123]